MQSFKLKNSRKRWWRCLGAVRSVISSRGKQVQAWKKVPEGPWTPRRAETREAQQRDAFPVSPGLRARAPALCQTALHPAAPGDERAPTLALLPHRAPLSPCKRVCGSVLSFPSHCARPPPRQSRLIPLTRNTPNSATAGRASPPRSTPIPAPRRETSSSPGAAHRPSFPLRRARSLLSRLLIQSQPFSTIFILFWSIILKLIPVCAIFNYFKLIGSSSNWTGRSPRSGRVLSFLASVEPSWPTHWRDRAGTALVFQADSRARRGNRLSKPRRGAAMLCSHPQGATVGKSVYLPTGPLTDNTTTGTMPISEFWVRKESFRARNLLKTFGR